MAELEFELDLLAAGPADIASYAASVAKDLTVLCTRHGLTGLAALFAAAAREADRAARRLGVQAEYGSQDTGGPPTAALAAVHARDLSDAMMLLCEAAGLASLATLFYAAREEAEAVRLPTPSALPERRAG